MVKTGDNSKFIQGEQIVCFLIQVFLNIDDVMAHKFDTRTLAEENIPATVKDNDILEAIFIEVL